MTVPLKQNGDRPELIVPHCDPVVNVYDEMYGIRKDRIEVIWPVVAEGSPTSRPFNSIPGSIRAA